MDGGGLLVLSFSRRFYFQLFFLLTNIPVHLYSPLRVLRRSILTALMRPLPFSYFTIQCYERLRFVVTRDYISIWIIQPAVRFYRRYEWTAEVYSFSRSLVLSTFLFSIVLFGWQTSPSIFTLRFACFAGRFLRRLCDPSIFHTLQFIVTRDYKSLLREITIQCYERLRFIITRYHASSLREITLHHYERLRFGVALITIVFELYNPP